MTALLRTVPGVLVALTAAAMSQVPPLINYHGVLADRSGEPLSGQFAIEFTLYDAATGGSKLWSESQEILVQNGIFNVLLGSVAPLQYGLFDGRDLYLALKVGGDAEMSPRKRLVSVGYAFRSMTADSITGIDASDFILSGQDSVISTVMLKDDAVSIEKIAPDIVCSVDGVSNDGGDIDLVAGENVTISADDGANTITISAAAGGSGEEGDITAVTAGAGLSGGGETGDLILEVGAGVGMSVGEDTVALDTVYTDNRYVNKNESNSISDVMIQDNAVGVNGIEPDIVSSIDGVVNDGGDIDLVAGENVTISADDNENRITISATAASPGIVEIRNSDKIIDILDPNGPAVTVNIRDEAITSQQLADGAVTTDKLADGAVSSKKLGEIYFTDSDWTISGKDMFSAVSGNVGIGTSDPIEQLEITGNFRLPETRATMNDSFGIIMSGASRFIHNAGFGNIFAGANAGNLSLKGEDNAGIGASALAKNINGNFNTGIGAQALLNNSDGSQNTAIGYKALLYNSTGNSNVAIGANANVSTTNLTNAAVIGANAVVNASNKIRLGDDNVTVIEAAAEFHSTGGGFRFPDGTVQTTAASPGSGDNHSLDAADGNPVDALYVDDDGNVGIGTTTPRRHLEVSGPGPVRMMITSTSASTASLQFMRPGNQNEDWQIVAHEDLQIGSSNMELAGSRVLMQLRKNGTVGIGAVPTNILTIARNSDTDPIADAWLTYSSRRWKTNVRPIEGALDKVERLRGVSYNWREDDKHDIGLIAEEVGEVVPEVVQYEENGIDAKSMDYARLVAILVEATKEQQRIIEQHHAEISALRSELQKAHENMEELKIHMEQ